MLFLCFMQIVPLKTFYKTHYERKLILLFKQPIKFDNFLQCVAVEMRLTRLNMRTVGR
jgi:hypothetical protein